ncbi:MAG: AAA family ATPase [Candidatus Helarchaeota archaeon]
MIKKLEIENFKSIKDLSIEVKKINIFIGAPNTGKSNILEAFGLFSFPIYGSIENFIRFENLSHLFFNNNIGNDIHVKIKMDSIRFILESDENNFSFKYYITKDNVLTKKYDYSGKKIQDEKISEKGFKYLSQYKFYRYDDKALYLGLTDYKFLFPPAGTNLYRVINNNKDIKELIDEILKLFQVRLVFEPPTKEIKFLKLYGDMIVLHPYCSMSDTIKRLIFHLAVIMSNENSILIFEEPETKTFPYYIKYLAELISMDDNNNQFFISTHNPYFLLSLLEKTKLSQIGVFIIYFQDGQTKCKIMKEKEIIEILDQGIALDIFFNIIRFLEP